jgi:hypothetical protein
MKDELVTLLPRWCGNMIVLRSEAVHDTSEYTAMTTARNPRARRPILVPCSNDELSKLTENALEMRKAG